MSPSNAQHISELALKFLRRLPELEQFRAMSALDQAIVESKGTTPSCVKFIYPNATLQTYRGQTAIPVEARMKDDDGEELSVVAYLDEIGRLMEIEFIRWDEIDVIAPHWATLEMW